MSEPKSLTTLKVDPRVRITTSVSGPDTKDETLERSDGIIVTKGLVITESYPELPYMPERVLIRSTMSTQAERGKPTVLVSSTLLNGTGPSDTWPA